MSDGEQADDAQKTEDPTPKKLEESRKKGQVALSREMNHWVILLAGTLLVATAAGWILSDFRVFMKTYIEQAHAMPGAPGGISSILSNAVWESLMILMIPLIGLMAAAAAGPLLQIGPLFATESIKPSIDKISPIKGFQRLFSLRSLVEFAKGVVKLSMVGLVGLLIVLPFFSGIEHLVGLPLPFVLDELWTLVIQVMIGVLIVMLVIAVLDIAYQRMEHTKKMRMTKQEVKDEYRQSEGDPHVRARLRQLRVERARQRMMQNVPEADVVITNPTHFAVALKYEPAVMDAPKCIAKGQDDVALRIREVAKEHDITVYENPPLARTLFDTVEIDESIPPEQYQAVAEVISFVFKQKGKI